MGRNKKYHTDIEKKVANNNKVKQFYWKNKRKLDLEASIRYWTKKIENMNVIGTDPSHPTYIKAQTKISVLSEERDILIKQSKNIQ